MEFFLLILLLLAVIGLSSFIHHFFPYIPVPLVQIALGVLLASLPLGIHIPMEPELFFVLFIAPLLFHDGKNVSRHALWKLRKPILLLALGLVFVTVFTIGYLIYWLIPSIPLPAAFALAAILSPTDVVAVGAISSRVKIPETIMHILEGEGLMNDASGLVAFKFAVAATVTGAFSLAQASGSFIVIAIGGLAGGSLLAILIIQLKIFIRRLGMEDVTIHMLIQLLTPFVIFYLVEHVHLSGILSVVAAGIVHTIYRERDQSPAMKLQLVSQNTWTVLIYILNGLVFLLLGLQVPSVISEIFKDPLFNNWEVSKYIFILSAALLFLRFLWIGAAWKWEWLKKEIEMPSMRAIGIITISGVRGAVTLAGAFTIPYVLADGAPFPQRSLIIFIAAGVILVTLLTASIFLPILARTEKVNANEQREIMAREAKLRTIDSAIRSIRELMNDENRGAAVSVIASYNQIRNQLNMENNKNPEHLKLLETEIRMKALEAEALYIETLKLEGKIDRETYYLSDEHIQRMRLAVTNRMRFRRLFIGTLAKRSVFKLIQLIIPKSQQQLETRQAQLKKMIQLKVNMAKAAIKYLNNQMTPENEHVYLVIIGEYSEMLTKFKLAKKGADSAHYRHLQRELRAKAFQAERDEIQKLYEEGEITADIIRKIRKQINIREAYWMEESSLHTH
ncbi:Na+/H+ antiporter [Neobacillus sp. MER 74]|uniref:Na+/H+ antiporter n=1 Tax=Bacillaceae TaxID=186817 RepID=UPI000BF5175B|nr:MULTISPECIES: Na+/H+ antiporter [Bacillaceae]MCM3118523.1 Na+/H+ antiporter [Neobacillus sp. MER 74]PFP24904.1 Na+/H+ antiporter [Bacillus sp. AFS073361]